MHRSGGVGVGDAISAGGSPDGRMSRSPIDYGVGWKDSSQMSGDA